ncbi:hypothetical protein [Oceanihabitans sediminis]|uniref:hypothetical protein n=1 Tax=Oceanihabitans sediminis TaxID=1812012 RepID=UPI00093151CA|nr:hypothetical protein [Oceanihabitans sediminis]MDX1278152.1 hypothetical protein [Oceanihabitans sediminis]
MKYLFYILFLSFVFSCGSTEKKEGETTKQKKVYDIYEPSEMAILMNQMYKRNEEIKKEILAGKIPTEFPSDFLEIHTANLSDFKERNEKFEAFSNLFIEAEKEIFNTASAVPVENRFNNAINLCISCHQTECTGPIPRIKKLIIK